MLNIVRVTLKGIFRDRVFHGIVVVALLLPLIPLVSTLSMRQVTELSITLSLSLISFILLLLSVFLGGTSLWKDMERRYTYSVLSLPLSRETYLFGRFVGILIFLALSALLLGCVAFVVVYLVSGSYPPDRPIAWGTMALAVFLDALKYILLVAVALLFSTVSTSFFLPIFGTISAFLAGNASQQVFDYIHTPTGMKLPAAVRGATTALYYILPNFSAFDLKLNAIYALPVNFAGVALTVGYQLIYAGVLLAVSALIYTKREMK